MVDLSAVAKKIEEDAIHYKGREVCEDPRGEFQRQLIVDGYGVPKVFVCGKVMRMKAPGDKKKFSGWCWYEEFDDTYNEGAVIGYGQYGSWKEGDAKDSKTHWSSRNEELLTRDQKHAIDEARAVAQKQREAEQAILHQEAALECYEVYSNAGEAGEHDYLKRKKIDACGAIKQDKGALIIPMMDENGVLQSVQYIKKDGFKHYHKGGKVAGAHFAIHGTTATVYVAEGYATAASVYMATGATCYVAFTAHKLLDVVMIARSHYPASSIVIAGDDDAKNEINIGKQKAKEIAQSLGVIAKFPDMKGKKGSDFNDVHCAYGLDEVAEQLNRVHELYEENPEDKREMPDHLYNPPGALGRIVDYYRLTDKRSNDTLAVSSALAVASLVCARNFDTNMSNRASLFLLNVARTGAGKEHCTRVAENVLEAAGMLKYSAANGYKSGSAVFSKCLDMPRHLAIIPEFGVFLEAMTGRNASSHQAQAKGSLLEVSTKLDGILTPAAYATKGLKEADKKVFNDQVINPAVTMMATTTPEVYHQINNEMIADGFLNRFIITISDEPMKYLRMVGKHDVPQSIISWIKAINKRVGDKPESASEAPDLITVSFTPEALEVVQDYEKQVVDRINDELAQSALKEMLPRCAELSMRVALIVALAKNPDAEFIYKEDAQWAVDFVRYNSDITLKTLKRSLADSPHERKRMNWLKAIRGYGGDGINARDLVKRKPFSAENKRTRDELLAELMENGLIAEGLRKSGGRGAPAKYYYAIKGE